jgi:hypothetical protein
LVPSPTFSPVLQPESVEVSFDRKIFAFNISGNFSKEVWNQSSIVIFEAALVFVVNPLFSFDKNDVSSWNAQSLTVLSRSKLIIGWRNIYIAITIVLKSYGIIASFRSSLLAFSFTVELTKVIFNHSVVPIIFKTSLVFPLAIVRNGALLFVD